MATVVELCFKGVTVKTGTAENPGPSAEIAFSSFGTDRVVATVRDPSRKKGGGVAATVQANQDEAEDQVALHEAVRTVAGDSFAAVRECGRGGSEDLHVVFRNDGIWFLSPEHHGLPVAHLDFSRYAIGKEDACWATAVTVDPASRKVTAAAPVGSWEAAQEFLAAHGVHAALGRPRLPHSPAFGTYGR